MQQPPYNMIHYSMVLYIRLFKDGPQNVVTKWKCIEYKENDQVKIIYKN